MPRMDLLNCKGTNQHNFMGQPVPATVRKQMESSFGHDFSNVRIHTDSPKADKLGAKAYTYGNDIFFAKGQYHPGTANGKKLLAHELAHVVQQRGGMTRATGSQNGEQVCEDPSLEERAAKMAEKALAGSKIPAPGGAQTTVSSPILQVSK